MKKLASSSNIKFILIISPKEPFNQRQFLSMTPIQLDRWFVISFVRLTIVFIIVLLGKYKSSKLAKISEYEYVILIDPGHFRYFVVVFAKYFLYTCFVVHCLKNYNLKDSFVHLFP